MSSHVKKEHSFTSTLYRLDAGYNPESTWDAISRFCNHLYTTICKPHLFAASVDPTPW